jgi:trimeric autotransporter adhesin
MLSNRSKLRLSGILAVLFSLALAASCRGFFVNPTLTAVSVGPQNLQLTFNQTFQMSATGTYSDGTQKTLTSGVTWSTSDPNVVAVGQTSGMVTAGTTASSATISASAGSCSGCSGSTTVTVVLQGVTSVTVNGGGQTIHPNSTTPAFLQALANGSIDISQSATWTVADSANTDQTAHFTQSFLAGSGEGFIPDNTLPSGTYTVKATYNNVSGTATLIVSNP